VRFPISLSCYFIPREGRINALFSTFILKPLLLLDLSAGRQILLLLLKYVFFHQSIRTFILYIYIFYVLNLRLLHLSPLTFHCVGGCWDRTSTVATSALAVRRSKLEPLNTRLDLISWWMRSNRLWMRSSRVVDEICYIACLYVDVPLLPLCMSLNPSVSIFCKLGGCSFLQFCCHL
jgi:hypothetical protein